ncbi:MAG: glycoside hydrolase family 9 protein [Planctomycetota bacterium]
MNHKSSNQRVWAAAMAGATTLAGACSAFGAKLVDARAVDDQHIMIHWLDGEVEYQDDGKGETAFMGHESHGDDKVVRYDPALNPEAASAPTTFTVFSRDDERYAKGLPPVTAYRRAKVNGAPAEWPEPPHTLEHVVYLKLPHKLRPDHIYTVRFDDALNSDRRLARIDFTLTESISEAIHVNLIGYRPDQTIKAADLYMWLGDGGARDYADYEGNAVSVLNVDTGQLTRVGEVRFGQARSNQDYGRRDHTASDVWHCDFSNFSEIGKFRLVIDGVGCSPEFEIKPDAYRDPFATSVIGFYYMRIGEPKNARVPAPRQPRFIPNQDPPGFRVIRTTMGPKHPDWKSLGHDPWDNKDWSAYVEPGSPTNPDAYGGHSDALDWDRRAEHVQIVWDLCLPFLLSNGAVDDDDLGIPESGNGIPDLLDEAQNEVDFWLRLRDGDGNYSFGVNNPTKDHQIAYQAASAPWMAWANAANAAMLADCFRLIGRDDLMSRYREAAIEAYQRAGDGDLDYTHNVGNNKATGRDLKALAAACLYNITGERKYEDDFVASTAVKGPKSDLDQQGVYSQYWPTAAYLMCAKQQWQPIHHPDVLSNLNRAVIHEATTKNLVGPRTWPSRRSSDTTKGWMQGVIANQALLIAHAAAEVDDELRQEMLEALILEADWSLGRNPLNMVLMTGLGSRQVEDIYTSGRNDGTPGVHPGHTPYMNAEPWGQGFMADPKGWYGSRGYPQWEDWPHGEALWRSRHCYANNEFTPQQTMGGKTALYAYLHALAKRDETLTP